MEVVGGAVEAVDDLVGGVAHGEHESQIAVPFGEAAHLGAGGDGDVDLCDAGDPAGGRDAVHPPEDARSYDGEHQHAGGAGLA